MTDDAQEKKQSAPYISWKTFASFIAGVHGKVPAQVDASILRNMSGTARSQLLSALKFLNLVNADGITQDSLKKLADAYNTDRWKSALSSFLVASYKPVIADLNLLDATPAMLRERFRNNGGVDGGTVDSAMRFYLSALKEADVPFSEHLVVRQRAPKGSASRRRTNGRSATSARDADEGGEVEIPEGVFEIPFSVIGVQGSAYVPEDVSPEQWDAISQYVKMVIGFRQQAQAKPKG